MCKILLRSKAQRAALLGPKHRKRGVVFRPGLPPPHQLWVWVAYAVSCTSGVSARDAFIE